MKRVETPCALHFTEYLKMLPPKWVLKHFFRKSDESRRVLSSAMIEEASRKFASPSSLKERFMELDSSLQLKCASIYLSGGRGLYAESVESIESPLVKSFLVFTAKDESGAVRYFGFDQFEKSLRALLASTVYNSCKEQKNLHPETIPVWRPVNDTVITCGLAFQKQLTKSKTGGLARKALNQLKKLTHDNTISGRSGAQDPHSSGFLTSFCLSQNFLTETESQYLINQTCLKEWLRKQTDEQLEDLKEYALLFSGAFKLDLLREVLEISENHWLSTSFIPESDRKGFIHGLKAFETLGLLSIRKHNGDIQFASAYHIENFPDPADIQRMITVMPDFSTILPQEASPLDLFGYIQICRLLSFDKVYRGSVDRETILNALSEGIDSEAIMSWFSQTGAPHNVTTTVREWIREFSRLYLSSDSFLVSSDERITSQLTSLEQLREYLEPVLAHAVFRIHPKHEHKVREILSGLGFDPRMPSAENEFFQCKETKPEQTPSGEANWTPLTEFAEKGEEISAPMKGTKYGADLKSLDLNEISHVIDFAILTGQRITVDYEGSPYIKENIYTIVPLTLRKGIEPVVEAEVPRTRTKKQFYLRKIKRIGVLHK
ncbi:hypothetical protein CHISP_1579 [Chitinispirillum alkaliphilum]|nr:hypothetical protein CHISP_1579 [Chitinispirillum alkaliphilum]